GCRAHRARGRSSTCNGATQCSVTVRCPSTRVMRLPRCGSSRPPVSRHACERSWTSRDRSRSRRLALLRTLEELLRRVDVRKVLVGDGYAERSAQRLPPVARLVLDEPVGRDLP